SSNQVQINRNKKDCWFPRFLQAELSFYRNGSIIRFDTVTIKVSLLENPKKCVCGSGNDGININGSIGFNKERNKAEKLGLNKKKYSSEFIEYNYKNGKIIKIDELSKVKGKVYIDESHISTGFSRNNNFPEAEYRVIKNDKDFIVLIAESRREDGELMIW